MYFLNVFIAVSVYVFVHKVTRKKNIVSLYCFVLGKASELMTLLSVGPRVLIQDGIAGLVYLPFL